MPDEDTSGGGIRLGPVLMIGASLAFTAMVGFVKVARDELSPVEVICWRGVIAVPITFLLAKRGLKIHNKRLLGLRTVLGFSAMFCFFTAAKGLAIGDLSIISRFQPIALAIMAPLFLGVSERPGRLIWAVLATGIVGCALIIGPELSIGSTFGLVALFASLLSAAAHLCVRRLGATDDSVALVFWFQSGTLVLALAVHILTTGAFLSLPSAAMLGPLLGVGLSASIGQVLMTRAYQLDNAPRVAAASYSAPVFGMLADVLFFATFPSVYAWIGGALVVSAGLLLVFRGKKKPRAHS